MQQPTTYVLELDEEEKKLLVGWMMVVQEQLAKKDKHYWNINARANRLLGKILSLTRRSRNQTRSESKVGASAKVLPKARGCCSRTNSQKISCQNDARLHDIGTKTISIR